MLLGIKTDGPVAEFSLYDSKGRLLAESTWNADRQLARGLLKHLNDFLSANGTTIKGLKGLFVFKGPGSFTGLRIGLTVLNTLAYAEGIPIVGEQDEGWREKAVQRLLGGQDDRLIMPFYGAEARITQPKK